MVGSLLAAVLIGLLGVRARDRNSIIGVLMPFGLGLGVLFLALYKGRSANKFGLLTGQVVAVDDPRLAADARHLRGGAGRPRRGVAARCCSPASTRTAPRRAGVPVRALSLVFMVVLGLCGGDGGAGGRRAAGARPC